MTKEEIQCYRHIYGWGEIVMTIERESEINRLLSFINGFNKLFIHQQTAKYREALEKIKKLSPMGYVGIDAKGTFDKINNIATNALK